MPLVPDGLPVSGHATATLNLPQEPSLVDAELDWQENSGQLIVLARDNGDPLLDLPWQITRQQLTVSDGRWSWPYAGFPLSGRLRQSRQLAGRARERSGQRTTECADPGASG